MKQCTFVGTNIFLSMARQLHAQGKISKSDLIDMEIRNDMLVPEDWKKDRVELE